MALDFNRWTLSGRPVAKMRLTIFVERQDLVHAAQMVLSDESGKRVTKALIEKTVKGVAESYGIGFPMAMGDWLSDMDYEDKHYEEAVEIIDRLFPETKENSRHSRGESLMPHTYSGLGGD